MISTEEQYDRRKLTRILWQLSSRLRSSGITADCQVISHARVPIVKVDTIRGLGESSDALLSYILAEVLLASLKFDLNINSDNGLKAVPVIKQYIDDMPALRPLVLAIKAFLSTRGLNSAATGGLSSYATICSTIGFLKVNSSTAISSLISYSSPLAQPL